MLEATPLPAPLLVAAPPLLPPKDEKPVLVYGLEEAAGAGPGAVPVEADGAEYQSELLLLLVKAGAAEDAAAAGFAQSDVELGSSITGAKEDVGVGVDQSHVLVESEVAGGAAEESVVLA